MIAVLNKQWFWLFLPCVAAYAITVSGTATAGVAISSGLAEVAWNAGNSPSMSHPPTSIQPSGGNHDFRNLPASLSGGLSTDWASTTWQISSRGIKVNGTAKEGFNGFFSARSGGWLYGQGVSNFQITLATDQLYTYDAKITESSTARIQVTGIGHGNGYLSGGVGNGIGVILPSIPITISTHAVGGTPPPPSGSYSGSSYSVDIKLSPVTNFSLPTLTFNDIIKNSVHALGVGSEMFATFAPQVTINGVNYDVSLDQLAKMGGFDHFNWEQEITHLPRGWNLSLIDNATLTAVANAPFDTHGNVQYGAGLNTFGGKIYDAPLDSQSFHYKITDSNGVSSPVGFYENCSLSDGVGCQPRTWKAPGFADNEKYYYGEGTLPNYTLPGLYPAGSLFKPGVSEPTSLNFYDRPTLAESAPLGSVVGFTTRLVGIKADGTEVGLPAGLGTSFTWTTDARAASTQTFFSTDISEILPAIISGGITNVTFDNVPEPSRIPSFSPSTP